MARSLDKGLQPARSIFGNSLVTAADAAAGRLILGLGAPDVIFEDQKASGTGGGTPTAAVVQTRVLNTSVRNVITGSVSLASNQIICQPGTYHFEWSAPVWRGDQHCSILYNVSDTVNYQGTAEYAHQSTDSTQSRSFGDITLVFPVGKVLELRHYVLKSTSNGFGLASGIGLTEIYSRVKIWKLA